MYNFPFQIGQFVAVGPYIGKVVGYNGPNLIEVEVSQLLRKQKKHVSFTITADIYEVSSVDASGV